MRTIELKSGALTRTQLAVSGELRISLPVISIWIFILAESESQVETLNNIISQQKKEYEEEERNNEVLASHIEQQKVTINELKHMRTGSFREQVDNTIYPKISTESC